MQLSIAGILDSEDVIAARSVLAELEFADGRATAGWSARLVKNNAQAVAGEALAKLDEATRAKLMASPVFNLAVRPKQLSKLIFARYDSGQSYGSHVDDALMGGLRTDVSFTLFLSEPEDYEGGELVIEPSAGEDKIKLPAGALYTYPAGTLHRVAPVTSGERLVCVGWVRSFIRSAEQRELLFDLDTARRTLFAQHGKTSEFDLLSKCTANLLRQWAED